MELTKEQSKELYGFVDEGGGKLTKTKELWMADVSKWVFFEYPDQANHWCLVPIIYWEMNGELPNYFTQLNIPGFKEVYPHVFTPCTGYSFADLQDFGIRFLENPAWGIAQKLSFELRDLEPTPRLKSKIIQVSTLFVSKDFDLEPHPRIYVLCEDGTLWMKIQDKSKTEHMWFPVK